MVRLSQKNRKNLIELEGVFSNREEFVSIICTSHNIQYWRKIPYSEDKYGNSKVVDPYISNKEKLEIFFRPYSWQLSLWGAISLSSTYTTYITTRPIEIDTIITGKILIGMNRIVKGPWYIHQNRIHVWNQDSHFELQMFDGDINRFLDFNKPI